VGLLPSSPGSPVAQGRDVQHRFSETMAPETIVPFELTLASVLRESFKSIAWLLIVKRHILCRIDLLDGHGSSHQSFLRHRASFAQAA